MGSAARISNYAAVGIAQLISMYAKPRGAIVALLPVILGITPNSGSLTATTLVRITGYNFENVSSVTIGGNPCTSLIVGGGIITCYAPTGTTGAKDVVVTGPAGATTLVGAFTYPVSALPPTLSVVSTSGGAVGDIGGAYTATLTGTNFIIGATTVTFGGTPATSVVVSSSTTLTCTVPAHATGAVSVVCTTVGGSNGANSLFRYFSPAELAITNWNKAPYAGSPYAANASAGTSGSAGTLTEATNPPTVGTALNGRAPATFNGTNQKLTGSTALTTLTSAAAWSLGVLVNPVATAATKTAGSGYLDPAIVADDLNGSWALTWTTSGFTAVMYDGVSWKDVSVAASSGAWHWVNVWFDGTNLNLQVDGGAVSQIAAGNIVAGAGNMRLGANYTAAAFAACSIAEDVVAASNLGAPARADLKSYVNTRHGLTL